MQIRYATPRGESGAMITSSDPTEGAGASTRFHEPSMMFFEENLRPGGTNGYTTSWGTNAHGKLAGCPPSHH
ncbi:hypothetical protein [Rhodococcus qingshengii]|uniref:hypothetical protein n=1 Tax=Rhodococcus qingshengii TaxID=334542 RepID=UPI003513E259